MSVHSEGHLGYGIVGGMPAESQLFSNLVMQGMLLAVGTTPPAQLTGTGDGTFYYDMSAGIINVDKTTAEFAAEANTLLETAGDIMASGKSKVYTIVASKDPRTSVVSKVIIAGAVATTAAQVAPTVAEIEAALPVGASWVFLGSTTINRTADTAATQTATTNLGRPSLIPQTVNRN